MVVKHPPVINIKLTNMSHCKHLKLIIIQATLFQRPLQVSHIDVMNPSFINAFVTTREFCNLIGLKLLLSRQGCIRSKSLRHEFEFWDDAITQFELSRFFTSLFLFCVPARHRTEIHWTIACRSARK